jgi:histidinol dehydrogenase
MCSRAGSRFASNSLIEVISLWDTIPNPRINVMAVRLTQSSENFDSQLTELLKRERETRGGGTDIPAIVSDIISNVRSDGDNALAEYTRKFDRFDVLERGLKVTESEIDHAAANCPEYLRSALQLAADRIRAYHERQLPEDDQWTDEAGVTLGWRWTPIDSVGLYVPGGLASYPSSVLMNAIPAKVAGVERITMVVPTPDNVLNPLVLVAAKLAGVTDVYRVGGAQAVAALAYGTQTIDAVDKIVGPGNAFVAEAKRQVFGAVGIDTIAGPSEILVVADSKSNPQWIATDLLSQAEHDSAAQSILITDDADFADLVAIEVEKQLSNGHPREETARAAWENNSAIIIANSIAATPALINRIAPEHLELSVEDYNALLPDIKHAGAIFLGRFTPEAIGDYIAGPDHVLPTTQVARYASGLSSFDFIKRSSIIHCSEESLRVIGPAAVTLAEAEGLYSHARSVDNRLNHRE